MNRTLLELTRAARDLAAPTDAQLLSEFVARRDDDAFAQLVYRHGPMVFAVCRRVLRHQHDSEDAFQATFLVLARKAAGVWPRGAVGSWLHGVAYRVAMKARGVRSKIARREHALEDVARDAPEVPPPDLADVLDRAIRKLPEAYRAAVVACDLEGRSRKDAAEQLGWKEGTLSGRLARARQMLAVRLKHAGLVVAAGTVPAATAEAVPNGLIVRAVGFAIHRGGVSAPVAALTEGVVRGMFLTKIRTAAAVVLAAGAMGVGVWSASGQGPGGGPGKKAGVKAAADPSQPADFEALARKEIDLLTQEMSQPGRPGETADDRRNRIDRLKARLDTALHLLSLAEAKAAKRAAKEPSDLERMQGEWIIGRRYIDTGPHMPQSVVEAAVNEANKDGTLIVVDGEKMTWQHATSATSTTTGYGDPNSATATSETVTTTQKRYFIKLDPSQSPRHIDVVDANGHVRKGIYKFEDGYFVICLNERGGRPKGFGDERVKDDEPMWTLWQPRPTVKKVASKAVDVGTNNLQGRWRVELVWTSNGASGPPEGSAPPRNLVWEFSGNKLRISGLDPASGSTTADYTFTTNAKVSPVEIDIYAGGKLYAKGLYDIISGAAGGLCELRISVAQTGPRPDSIARRGRSGITTLELSEIAQGEEAANANPERELRAANELVDNAMVLANLANQEYRDAVAKRDAVRDRSARKGPAGTYTLHVRTPLAAEVVTSVKVDSTTVLDALQNVPEMKVTGATAWLVRQGKVLPIDWVGLTRNGVTTTNYQILQADKVFVQVNVGK